MRFRCQHPIGPYIVDFFCPAARLAIEVDGEAHERGNRVVRDTQRDAFMKQNGYRVLRVAAAELLRDPEPVIAAIASLVVSPLHRPSDGPPPRSGEDL
ncbi:endonuclease domain-containing protein [Sphingomonas sp. RS6]